MMRETTPSELSINIFQRGTEHNDEIDTLVFFEYISPPPINNLVGKFHIVEAYHYDGPLIATDLNSCRKMITFPTPHPKLFFINDLEWLRFPYKNYHELAGIYRNPDIRLICRGKDHQKCIENAWNRDVAWTIPDYNFYEPKFLEWLLPQTRPLYGNRKQINIEPYKFQNLLKL